MAKQVDQKFLMHRQQDRYHHTDQSKPEADHCKYPDGQPEYPDVVLVQEQVNGIGYQVPGKGQADIAVLQRDRPAKIGLPFAIDRRVEITCGIACWVVIASMQGSPEDR